MEKDNGESTLKEVVNNMIEDLLAKRSSNKNKLNMNSLNSTESKNDIIIKS
jgi:hypothetical protein